MHILCVVIQAGMVVRQHPCDVTSQLHQSAESESYVHTYVRTLVRRIIEKAAIPSVPMHLTSNIHKKLNRTTCGPYTVHAIL